MKVRLALAAGPFVASALVGAGTPEAPTAGRPVTLVRVNGLIDGFAQDAQRIAWSTQAGRPRKCVRTVHIRNLTTRRTLLTRQAGCVRSSEGASGLVLAGRAALWQNLVAGGNSERVVDIWTAVAGARAHKAEHLHLTFDPVNAPDLPTAGSGKLLVYDSEHTSSGSIRRIVSGRPRTLFAFLRPAMLAVADRSIAVVRRRRNPTNRFEAIGQVRRADGSLVASFRAAEMPAGVALGSGLVALLTWGSGTADIALFDASTGQLRHGVSVADHSVLAGGPITGHRIVFASGLRIRVLDTRSLATSTLAVARAVPSWLSSSGRRVAWVETLGGHARIRALTLPR
jgi:hypothetical protein